MKLLILGSSGLLGNTITKFFFSRTNFETYGTLRNNLKISFFDKCHHSKFYILPDILDSDRIEKIIRIIEPKVIINCIGVTNKNLNKGMELAEKYIQINSLFPHKLCKICSYFKIRLIHLSSDCVFSGKKGFYNEKDNPDSLDFYGRSKLLGEVSYENTITLRKSAIGHELDSNAGLLEWFLSQKGKVEGFQKAIFSGLTVLELSKIIEKQVIPNRNLNGIYHISGPFISKYELLKIFAEIYKKKVAIIPNELENIDRTLDASKFNKISGYKPKNWYEMISEMYQFNLLGQ
tara:strand:+ start:1031 stop:1903 length:873 start_codon:yes stop_codon:yes gene_type:complete